MSMSNGNNVVDLL